MRRKLFFSVALITTVIVGLCSYNRTETPFTSLLCFRQFDRWTEDVMVEENVRVTVEHRHSHDPYFGSAHFGFGPGDDDFSVATFTAAQRRFRWAAAHDEIPIVLRSLRGRFWLATLDRTDLYHIRFRFYRFDEGQAVEVTGGEFPRPLAVQNMWLRAQAGFVDGKTINEFDIVAALDPASFLFQDSLTAKMWACLETGQPYNNDRIKAELLRDYKARYIAAPAPVQPSPQE